jgi:hypothetical protein
MDIDFVTIGATFAAAIGGSWFGANATNKQTKDTIALEKELWFKQRSLELLTTIDEFLNYSYRREALELHERDHLSRKLITLMDIVLSEKSNEVNKHISDVRNWILNKPCNNINFYKTKNFFDPIKKVILKNNFRT